MNQRPHIQTRPRPIPVHMPLNFKAPIGPLHSGRYTAPVRKQNLWKSNQILKLSTEKPFLSSPAVSIPEYDYHIQTNNIPHPNTIQQNDEKGPIHTIPAPNLSLADKPQNIEQFKSAQDLQDPILIRQTIQQQQLHQQLQQQQFQQQLQQSLRQQQQKLQNNVVEIQKSQQYEVTESPSPLKLPLYFAPDPNPVRNPGLNNQLHDQPHAEFLVAPSEQLLSNQLTSQDLYKLLNTYPQQQLVDTYPLSISQQPQLQQHIQQQKGSTYQILGSDSRIQLPQQDHVSVKNKLPVQPQFQLFNYNEQDQRNLPNNQISSRVGADYSVKPYDGENPGDALAQAQFVQHFYDTRDEGNDNNNVEQDSDLRGRDSAFFSTLPSKEAAETLASLQEAGELNSKSQMNVKVSKKIPIAIYVPDNYDDTSEDNGKEESDNRNDYEDISVEENIDANNYGRSSFGNRLRSKS